MACSWRLGCAGTQPRLCLQGHLGPAPRCPVLQPCPLARAPAAAAAAGPWPGPAADSHQPHQPGRHLRSSSIVRAKGKGSKDAVADADALEDDDNIIFLDDEDEGAWYEDEEEGGAEEEEEWGEMGLGTDEDPGPEILTGNVTWGDTALAVAESVLQQRELQGLQLYLFRVLPPSMKIEIRLDKLEDPYGSPSIDDIALFSRKMGAALEAELGLDLAGQITLEVSSPGAERQLIVPQDLLRFQGLPMRVEYMSEVGQLTTLVLQFLELEEAEGTTLWQLADVKANAPTKGRGLSKRQREQRFSIPLSALERVRIFVDM